MTNANSMTPEATTITVLGTRIIGAPVARNLRKRAFTVRAWNPTHAKAEAPAESGVEVADTPADAVRSADVILTTLGDGPAVLEAMTAAVSGLSHGAVWAQMSTVGLAAFDPLPAFTEQRGLNFYDAPVQGTRQQNRASSSSSPPAWKTRAQEYSQSSRPSTSAPSGSPMMARPEPAAASSSRSTIGRSP